VNSTISAALVHERIRETRREADAARDQRAAVAVRHRDDVNALAHRAAGGDERAWRLLVGRLEATIDAVARRFGLSPADREDVAQRTWLAFVRHIDRLADHPALAGWLATTARNESLNALRASRREVPVDEPEIGGSADVATVDDELLAAEQRDALHRALDRVPEHERRLMRLLLSESEPSYAEISAALNVPKGSIGPTRARCLVRLRGDAQLVSVVYGRPQPGHDLR
jgi:RNA polymerase sigma factor (sigma-70 family)